MLARGEGCRMPARKNPRSTDAEEYHDYHTRERVERGEKVTGVAADWLDRRGPDARVARRADADRRHDKGRSTGPHR